MLRNHSHSLFGKKMTLEPHKHGLRTLNSSTSIHLSREPHVQSGHGAPGKYRKTVSAAVKTAPVAAPVTSAASLYGSLPSNNQKLSPDLPQTPSFNEVLPKAGFDGDPVSIEYKRTNNTLRDIDHYDRQPDDSDFEASDATSDFHRHLKRLKQQNSDFDLLLRGGADSQYKFTVESRASKASRLRRLSVFVGRCLAC